jgi:hypothetical protein
MAESALAESEERFPFLTAGVMFYLDDFGPGRKFGEGEGDPRVMLNPGGGRGPFSSNLALGGGGRDESFVRCGSPGSDACCFSGPNPSLRPAAPCSPLPLCSGRG